MTYFALHALPALCARLTLLIFSLALGLRCRRLFGFDSEESIKPALLLRVQELLKFLSTLSYTFLAKYSVSC
jgi:hypothetical protein